jgi:hypothetical protein
MKKLLLLILALLSFNSHAEFNEWSDVDKGLFVAHSALLVADWSQTRYASKNPDEFQETNIFLGSHPNTSTVDVFFLAQLIGSYYFVDYFKDQRTPILIGLTIGRGYAVGHNMQVGVKVGF